VPLVLKSGMSWWETYARCVQAAPEAFDSDRLRNLVRGEWRRIGIPGDHVNSVDGTPIPGPPLVEPRRGRRRRWTYAVGEHTMWAGVELDERRTRVSDAVDALIEHRDLLALLLVWEIGKPWRLACADVDRCVDGVRWYLGQIERQLTTSDGKQRRPLPGPVSNIASWNYPMSVQVHAELVQALAGNAVVAKTPSQGGFHTLTLAHALMRRAGLPVTLLSGMGSHMGEVLIRSEGIGALAFVGGRANGRRAAVSLADTGRRHMLEQEGLNAWGIWEFSQWDLLAQHMRKGFEYAKQRCTAYPRYVVQRRLDPGLPRGLPPGHQRDQVRESHSPSSIPMTRSRTSTSARSSTPPRRPSCRRSSMKRSGAGVSRSTGARSATEVLSRCPRTRRPTSHPPASSNRRRRGRSTTLSRSARWTRSSSSTPRRSSWPP
jgi:hypothetical protein